MSRARQLHGQWYLPVSDFHEMRLIARDALLLLDADEWTPEDREALVIRFAKATNGERVSS